MNYLFEAPNALNAPYEGFIFDANKECFPIKPHWHYFMELIYILEGTAFIECDGESYILSPGECILFPPQAVHAIYASTHEMPIYTVIKFDMSRLSNEHSYSPPIESILAASRTAKNVTLHFSPKQLSSIDLKMLFHTLVTEITQKDYGYDIHVQSLLWTLFINIFRYWRASGFDISQISSSTSTANEMQALYTIAHYIDKHSNEPLKVTKLAEMCHMSYSYFSKSFQKLYGKSCKQYIEFIRVYKACDYLRFTNYDLSYISEETGFSDCSHFIKTFKKLKGITPRQFRHQLNK